MRFNAGGQSYRRNCKHPYPCPRFYANRPDIVCGYDTKEIEVARIALESPAVSKKIRNLSSLTEGIQKE